MVHDDTSYVLSANLDTEHLTVDTTPMDHRMIFHKNNLPGSLAPLPSTQTIATESDVCITQELGDMRRTQEEALAEKE